MNRPDDCEVAQPACGRQRRSREPKSPNQAMRILHVVPTYLPAVRYGGPIYSVHALCQGLAAAGDEVHVMTTSVDGFGR